MERFLNLYYCSHRHILFGNSAYKNLTHIIIQHYDTTLSHTLLKTHIITHIVTNTFFSGIMKPGVDVLVGPGCPIDWLRVSTYGTYDFCTLFKFAFFQTMTSALLLFYFHLIIIFYFIFTICGCGLLSVRLILYLPPF